MKKMYKIFKSFGIDFYIIIMSLRGIPAFIESYFRFAKTNSKSIGFQIKSLYPFFSDRYEQAGSARGHYFHQDLHVAQKIFSASPRIHADVGSRMDGFVAHVATFRPIEVMDIRPLNHNISNINFVQLDLMIGNEKFIEKYDSLSCLHTLEHLGLGRYGDPINPSGHLDGFNNLYKMLAKDGILYFSVPIGEQRIEFNAHRVFSISYLLEMFADKFVIKSFSYVDDGGELHKDIELSIDLIKSNCNCNYGCGIFELVKVSRFS